MSAILRGSSTPSRRPPSFKRATSKKKKKLVEDKRRDDMAKEILKIVDINTTITDKQTNMQGVYLNTTAYFWEKKGLCTIKKALRNW